LQKIEDEFAVAGHEAEVVGEGERPSAPSKKAAAKTKRAATKKRAGKRRMISRGRATRKKN